MRITTVHFRDQKRTVMVKAGPIDSDLPSRSHPLPFRVLWHPLSPSIHSLAASLAACRPSFTPLSVITQPPRSSIVLLTSLAAFSQSSPGPLSLSFSLSLSLSLRSPSSVSSHPSDSGPPRPSPPHTDPSLPRPTRTFPSNALFRQKSSGRRDHTLSRRISYNSGIRRQCTGILSSAMVPNSPTP